MEIVILDSNFVRTTILEDYTTLIWKDKYDGFGDFELTASVGSGILSIIAEDMFLTNSLSDHVMIVESVKLITDPENGNYVLVKGRSLEVILNRRVVWDQLILLGGFEVGVKTMLEQNAISPIDPNRTLPNLIFQFSTDGDVTSAEIDTVFHGEYIGTAISNLVMSLGFGFKIILDDDLNMVFTLYSGKNRSFEQTVNEYVIFSNDYDNLSGSSYLSDSSSLKTVALIGGEGKGSDRVFTTTSIVSGPGSGLYRRELFVDAASITKTVTSGTLTDLEYIPKLQQAGLEKLAEHVAIRTFEGAIEDSSMFVYNTHFGLGDIVQVANEYGLESTSRISEVIISHESTGALQIIPKFTDVF